MRLSSLAARVQACLLVTFLLLTPATKSRQKASYPWMIFQNLDREFTGSGSSFPVLMFWWHLCDEAAESNRFWGQKGLHGLAVLRRQKHDWYATSYDVSPKQIMQEAAEDFTNSFLTNVP